MNNEPVSYTHLDVYKRQNLNTASSHLLTYISGLGPQLAQNIVNYRVENGAFNSRKELMKVCLLYTSCATAQFRRTGIIPATDIIIIIKAINFYFARSKANHHQCH